MSDETPEVIPSEDPEKLIRFHPVELAVQFYYMVSEDARVYTSPAGRDAQSFYWATYCFLHVDYYGDEAPREFILRGEHRLSLQEIRAGATVTRQVTALMRGYEEQVERMNRDRILYLLEHEDSYDGPLTLRSCALVPHKTFLKQLQEGLT